MEEATAAASEQTRSKTKETQKEGIRALWQITAFRQMLISRVLSNFGDSIDAIAYSWLVYMLTGSKLLMGTLFAVGTLPTIVLGMFAGVLVDRWSNKKTVVASALIRGSIVALTALLYVTGMIEVWHLFVLSLLLSSVAAFSNPAMMSWMPRVLPKEKLVSANSLAASAAQTARLGGLAFSGALIAWAGLGGAFALNAAMLLLSASVLGRIPSRHVRRDEQPAGTKASGFWKDLGSGMSYLYGQKVLLLIVGLAGFLNFAISPMEALEAAYVGELLKQGPAALSVLSIGMAAGMIASGLLLGQIGGRVRKGTLMIAGFLFMGLSIGLLLFPPFADSPQLALIFATALYFLLGLSVNMIASPTTSYLMEQTPPEMLGRVGALFNTICLSAFPIGSALSGALAESLELKTLYPLMGTMVLLPAIVLFAVPKLRTLR